jgi:FKBP-type peptidyl-prolyl cis-trans isomerase (trigger factor)
MRDVFCTQDASAIKITSERTSSHLFKTEVSVPSSIVIPIREQVISLFQHHARARGFENLVLPRSFVLERHYMDVQQSTMWFILKHFVLDLVVDDFSARKVLLAHNPRLTEVLWENDEKLLYYFDISTNEISLIKEWKMLPFKTPKRKLYKDLDKQVETFIERESALYKQQDHTHLADNDWVCFTTGMLDNNHHPIINSHHRTFWMKLTTKYLVSSFQRDFVNKKIGDKFVLTYLPLDESLQEAVTEHNPFQIEIVSINKGNFFSLDIFKNMFRLKNRLDVHRKLIEVFSYRNDISQRKAIIEEVFHLFFSKNRFEVPKHLVLRKQEDILSALKKNPDYYVYRSQPHFDKHVAFLAERQLKEELIIDKIAYDENLIVNNDDISSYLHLFNTDRLKEFIHFKPVLDIVEDSHVPLHESTLRQVALREKTLNHIIHLLTR